MPPEAALAHESEEVACHLSEIALDQLFRFGVHDERPLPLASNRSSPAAASLKRGTPWF